MIDFTIYSKIGVLGSENMGFLKRLFDPSKKLVKQSKKIADKVFLLEDYMRKLTDDEIKNKTLEFKKRLSNGETLDDILVEAFALVREASTRVTGLTPYYVQVMGAYIIHGGNVSEMKTGEGKTLTAVMPAYLNALTGKGVHIVTVNEYLARREAEGEIGDLFRFLGLTVGLNLRDLTNAEKQEVYNSDILYSTNSELGFDYLRDHMVLYKEDLVNQRGLNFAIIDESDSILIDEARTPLIISGGARQQQSLYKQADRFAKNLRDEEYLIDIESNTIELQPKGIKRAEDMFNVDNLYDIKNVELLHRINNALRANYIMKRDKEYMVSDDSILIIDQFTGRVLPGRQYSEGLHQALEAKENVQIKKETVTVATITIQNFFRMYKKLAGMTGTAKTEEEEFKDIYNMLVCEIPTNAPVIRKDMPDYIFATKEAKYKALIREVKRRNEKGQPILIGTIAVEDSELLSSLLRKERLNHEVLNAKNHAREADIIANAGNKGSITIATNMAGRGTDIKLGEGVVELGGLAVLGSERHESRRIDNQLRGRSGRQGDPGYSRFFISAEDELLMRFGGEAFRQRMMFLEKLNNDNDEPLASKMFSRFVKNAQLKIEGANYDARKTILKYDDVIRQQREIIYKERTDVIKQSSIEDQALQMLRDGLTLDLSKTTDKKGNLIPEEVVKYYDGNLFRENTIRLEEVKKYNDPQDLYNFILKKAEEEVKAKRDDVPTEVFNEFLKVVLLRVIDTYWTRHIDTMSELRQGVGLQAYGSRDPLIVYQKEGRRLFNIMTQNISTDVARYVLRAIIRYNTEREEVVKNTSTNEGETASIKKQRKRKVRGRNRPWY